MEVKIKLGNEMLDATIEMVDGVMVVSPMEAKFEPKDGDVVTSVQNGVYEGTAIFEYEDNLEAWFHAAISRVGTLYTSGYLGYIGDLRLATEEEKKKLFDKLAEEGYEFDFEKKELIKLKWKPNYGALYYKPGIRGAKITVVSDSWAENVSDKSYYDKGWVFKTYEECDAFCDKLRQAIEGVKP